MLAILGTVWCAPITVLAMVFYVLPMWVLGGFRPCPSPRAGVLHLRVPKDHWHNKLWKQYSGLAVPNIIMTRAHATEVTVKHELRHVEQQWALGPMFPLAYVLFLAAFGYSNNPFEVDARQASREK